MAPGREAGGSGLLRVRITTSIMSATSLSMAYIRVKCQHMDLVARVRTKGKSHFTRLFCVKSVVFFVIGNMTTERAPKVFKK